MGAESELVLSQLCQRSFLSLWSYPNPYNDKGIAKRKEGKELCDLLVVFGNDVVIFSDKSCAYPSSGDERLDWRRWYKRAVQESIDQILGAERWLKMFPSRVFADNRCKKRLDVQIPPSSAMRVHRVVVALGARRRCQAYFGGGSGSLPIRGGVGKDDDPFYIGEDGGTNGFVHVFDDVGLNVVLGELDTAADLMEYLSKKEEIFKSNPVMATGEEDLLAHYLMTMVDGEHGFLPNDMPAGASDAQPLLFVDESAFPTLTSFPQYSESKRANKPSYAWDRMIEHFIAQYRDGAVGVAVEDLESALREATRPGRVIRRQLGKILTAAARTSEIEKVRYISVIDPTEFGKAYAVVSMHYDGKIAYEEYQARRRKLMELYARSLRVRFESIDRVLIVGIQPINDKLTSEDLAWLILPTWTPELEERTLRDMELFGLGAKPQRYSETEFPTVAKHLGSKEAERRRRQSQRLNTRAMRT